MKKILLIAVLLLTAHCSLLTARAQCTTPGTVCFPGAIDTQDSLFGRLTDGPQTTLNGTISAGATTITVVSAGTAAFGSSGSLKIDSETIYYTGKTSNSFTGVIRGRDGTTATTHVSGSIVRSPFLSVHLRTLSAAIIATETAIVDAANDVNSFNGRNGNVVPATDDYTWAQINKGTSSLADITTRSASDLTSGTLPNARFPGILPALNGSLLTNLDPSNLGSPIPIAKGGSGATTAAAARTNYGLGNIATYNVNTLPDLTANSFTGNGSGLTGIGTGTGGVINTGSTTIGADSDADGVGIISLQTRGVERWAVSNLGALGRGTNAPVGSGIDFEIAGAKPGGTGHSGSYAGETYFLFGNNDPGNPDWTWEIHHSFQDNAPNSARPYHSWSWGYNLGSSPHYVASDHSFGFSVETPYISGVGTEQLEYYNWFIGRPGVTANPGAVRPFSMNIHLDDNAIDIDLRANLTIFGYQDYSNDWLYVSSSATTGTLMLQGNSQIKQGDATGAGDPPEWFITKSGFDGLLGYNNARHEVVLSQGTGNLRLPGDSNSGTNIDIRAGSLLEGSLGTLRYNRSTGAGWQFSNNSTDFYSLNPLRFIRSTDFGVGAFLDKLALEHGWVGVGFDSTSGIDGTLHVKAHYDMPTLILQAVGGQGSNLQEWRKSDGTVRAFINYDASGLYLGEDNAASRLRVGGVYSNGGLYKPAGIMQFSLGADQSFSFRRGDGEVFQVNYAGVVYLLDGSMKAVSFGASDSCSSGYKCLRVAN